MVTQPARRFARSTRTKPKAIRPWLSRLYGVRPSRPPLLNPRRRADPGPGSRLRATSRRPDRAELRPDRPDAVGGRRGVAWRRIGASVARISKTVVSMPVHSLGAMLLSLPDQPGLVWPAGGVLPTRSEVRPEVVAMAATMGAGDRLRTADGRPEAQATSSSTGRRGRWTGRRVPRPRAGDRASCSFTRCRRAAESMVRSWRVPMSGIGASSASCRWTVSDRAPPSRDILAAMVSLLLLAACSGPFNPNDSAKPSADGDADVDADSDTDSGVSSTISDADADGDGYSTEGGDCDDGDANVNPGATDVAGDGLDVDCDGVDGVDGDADGYASTVSGGDDCDDSNFEVNPGAAEGPCNGTDDDCDGAVDDGSDCEVPVISGDDRNCASFGHAYLIGAYQETTRLPKDAARAFCTDRGYDLVIVDDECEWTWVESLTAAYFDGSTAGQEWWGGLYCPGGTCADSSDFEWIDGSDGYVEWSGNGFSSGWDCAELTYLQLSDVDFELRARAEPCENSHQFICESSW